VNRFASGGSGGVGHITATDLIVGQRYTFDILVADQRPSSARQWAMIDGCGSAQDTQFGGPGRPVFALTGPSSLTPRRRTCN